MSKCIAHICNEKEKEKEKQKRNKYESLCDESSNKINLN